jgi:hypothetical protein
MDDTAVVSGGGGATTVWRVRTSVAPAPRGDLLSATVAERRVATKNFCAGFERDCYTAAGALRCRRRRSI